MYVAFKFEFAVAELDLQEDPTSGGINSVWVCVCVWGINRYGISSKDFNDFSFIPRTC